MQGKPADNTRKRKRSKKPTGNKKKEEQDLVQKYIINPKKGDAKYNRKEKSSMDSGTFKLLLLLILVVGFTAGVAYGIFNFDFNALSSTDSIAVVQDTAFPELNNTVVPNTTKTTTSKTNSTYSSGTSDSSSSSSVETTRDSSSSSSSSSYNQGSRSSSQSSQSSSSSSSSSQSSQSSSSSSGTGN